jgi:hypothetical protein
MRGQTFLLLTLQLYIYRFHKVATSQQVFGESAESALILDKLFIVIKALSERTFADDHQRCCFLQSLSITYHHSLPKNATTHFNCLSATRKEEKREDIPFSSTFPPL